jgi:hypothetical protein
MIEQSAFSLSWHGATEKTPEEWTYNHSLEGGIQVV